jgi:DNA polymerase-3 subunit gamma/tau
MGYQVLARKWRPHAFHEVIGQEHVLRMLINALDNQRLHHAYLFTGTRGVGKTTLARILAKCLNCEIGITSQPCGTCSACTSIDAGRFLDLLEIDAASRTKVEDTRELLDNVQYAPTQGRYKIYLIDEVHMLSGHSFNALLKTLEEPPAHVKFLLATTDPKRLPITILSRCLQFHLKHVVPEKITQQLEHICTAENIQFETAGLVQLAQAADGSMRDAMSLLDQAIAFCRDNITNDDVRHMLGNIEEQYIVRLLEALAEQDGKTLFSAIAHLAEHASNFDQALETLLSMLHQIAIAQAIPDLAPTNQAIAALAKRFTSEDVQLYYQIALIGRRDLSLAPTPLRGFEMILLRMLAFKPMLDAPAASPPKQQSTIAPTPQPAPVAKTQKAAAPTTTPPPAAATSNNWADILPHLGLAGMTYALASNCTLVAITEQAIELLVSNKHVAMLNKNSTDRIEEALRRYFNKPLNLHIKQTTEEIDTAAKQYEQVQKAQQEAAVKTITADNHVKKIMDVFNATLDMNSIKAVDTV